MPNTVEVKNEEQTIENYVKKFGHVLIQENRKEPGGWKVTYMGNCARGWNDSHFIAPTLEEAFAKAWKGLPARLGMETAENG